MARLPLLVILGATGTGKSKIGIEMAARFAGEVISADSMQVYKGLDIITNKVTAAEREQVPHHLLDLFHPLKEFTVLDFRNKALATVEDIQRRGKLPVVVGGTNYYIESLLWKVLIDDRTEEGAGSETLILDRLRCGKDFSRTSPDSGEVPEKRQKISESADLRESYSDVSNEDLHRRLQDLDPEMASSLHPNNRRKVLRSLEVLEQTGKRHSELLEEQKSCAGGSGLGGPLRYQGCVMLWLQCDQNVLDERLDRRVDEMIEQGLVQELLGFHEEYNKERIADKKGADYTRGIFQSIGFKEFHNYLILDEEGRQSVEGKSMLLQGIADLKLATRRYARKQIKWIKNRFLRQKDRQAPPVYGLDGTNPAEWSSKVFDIAVEIVAAHLQGSTPNIAPLSSSEEKKVSDHVSHTCAVCQRLFIGTHQWELHRRSKKHERAVKRQKKLEGIEKAVASCPSSEDALVCS